VLVDFIEISKVLVVIVHATISLFKLTGFCNLLMLIEHALNKVVVTIFIILALRIVSIKSIVWIRIP